MNKIKIQTQKLDEQVDVQELAILTHTIWKITKPESQASIEGIGNWIQNLENDEVPIIVQAYNEHSLVGWILLFVHDSKRLEINPWALGGHPLIHPNDSQKSEITQLLLTECINYASKTQHTRIELCYEKIDSIKKYPVDTSIYQNFNFLEEDEIVFMTLNLEQKALKDVKFDELDTILLKDSNDNDLYTCFYDSFSVSGDRNFLSHSDEEREGYYKERFDKKEKMIDEASIVLVDRTKYVGFTLVRPTHGEGNGNLWVMGIIPEYRGLQLGSKLLGYTMSILKKLGYKTMSLAVDTANEAALKLYKKHNFIKGWQRITHVWKSD